MAVQWRSHRALGLLRREEEFGSFKARGPFTGIRLGANSSAFVKC